MKAEEQAHSAFSRLWAWQLVAQHQARRIRTILAAVVGAALPLPGMAVEVSGAYPVRPVRVINPYPPGGASDPSCRLLADALTKSLGQQFIVDNRGGAAGNIGAALGAKSAADGYVVLFASGTIFTINPYLYKSQGFDPKKDFDPIVNFASLPNVMAIHPSIPAHTLAEFTQYVKGRPENTLNYASNGTGSSLHLAAEMFKKLTFTQLQHIPYVSPGLATQETMTNRTQVIFHLLPAIAQQVKAGNLRALAVLSTSRSSVLPEVMTTKEAGMPELQASNFYPVMVPRGSPKAVIDKLNRQINSILTEPAVRARVMEMGMTLLGGTPADVTRMIETEGSRWSDVIRSAGITPD
jgi:tripartite-type tricarboxylate transporter receptor subunit TctC